MQMDIYAHFPKNHFSTVNVPNINYGKTPLLKSEMETMQRVTKFMTDHKVHTIQCSTSNKT